MPAKVRANGALNPFWPFALLLAAVGILTVAVLVAAATLRASQDSRALEAERARRQEQLWKTMTVREANLLLNLRELTQAAEKLRKTLDVEIED